MAAVARLLAEDIDEDHARLYKQCKLLAYVHHVILRPAPAKFITCFITPDFQRMCDKFQMGPAGFWARGVLMCSVLMAMPLVYAHTSMPYPCAMHQLWIGRNQTGLAERFVEKNAVCNTEDLLRGPWSLVIGPIALCCAQPMWHCLLYLARSRFRLGVVGPVGPTCYAAAVNFVRPFLPNLLIQPARGPGAFEFPMITFYALLMQMSAVALITQSVLATVVALAVGRLFLMACNNIYACGGIFRNAVEAELARCGKPSMPLLRILHGPAQTSIWVTDDELNALWEWETPGHGKKMQETIQLSDGSDGKGFPGKFGSSEKNLAFTRYQFEHVPCFLTKVYVTRANSFLVVDLVEGSVCDSDGRVWQMGGFVSTSDEAK